MRYSSNPSDMGTKLGPKLVHLISQGIIATKVKLLDTEHRARVHSMQTIIDKAGHEVADLYRPLLQQIMRDQDLPPEVREYLEKTVSGTHQWHSIGGMLLQGGAPASALSTIISNFLAPGVRFAVAHDPQILPANETLVQLGVKGAMGWGDVNAYVHGGGYADFTIQALAEGYRQYPELDLILELLRRGEISQGDARTAFTRNAIPGHYHNALLTLTRQHISPADAADMVVRGIINEGQGRQIASFNGVDSTDFDLLVRDTGEPLGLMELLEAYRRGFIDQSRLQHGILQSRIRNEWIDVAEKLRFSPMSIADAVNATVQNHMSQSEMNTIAEQNGLLPGQAGILYQTAGEPLSRTEMEQLYDRGQATQTEVEQALRESRLKNKYIPHAFALHAKILPIFVVERSLRYGGMSASQATRIILENGYSKSDASAVVASGTGQRIETAKNKTVSAIETAYENNLIPEHEAQALIEGMGFSKEEASFILKAAEFRRQSHVITQAVNSLRGKYVAHHIVRNAASGFLDALGIPATQRDYLLALWDIERGANARTLTEAQVVKAVKLKLINENDGIARLEKMGYTAIDAVLLLKGA